MIVVIFDVIIVLALTVGDMLLLMDFSLGRGLLLFGVDSVELFIGESDGMCCCFSGAPAVVEALDEPFGGDGVIDRDSVRRV